MRLPDGSLKIVIYRKPTHTDQYLNFQSNHPLEHKLGIVCTLYHRANTVISQDSDKKQETEHIDTALIACGYPKWAITKATQPRNTDRPSTRNTASGETNKGTLVLPYIPKLSEELRRVFGAYGWQVSIKPTSNLRQQLVAPNDKTDKKDITGPLYLTRCQGKTSRGQCTETYIGETERSIKARFLEHRHPSSTSSEVSQHIHIESPGHNIDLQEVEILNREPRFVERGIREAIQIRVHQPTLNRDGGRHKLSSLYDTVLRSMAH